MTTGIAWCDETWNPVTGCTPISEGCTHCYAARMATRLAGRMGYPATLPFDPTFHTERVNDPRYSPLRWKKPRKVFVCSMGDLFHGCITYQEIDRVWRLMALCQRHTFIVLTKRGKIMWDFVSSRASNGRPGNRFILDGHFVGYNPTTKETRQFWGMPEHDPSTGQPTGWIDLPWPLPNVWLGVTVENQLHAKRVPTLLSTPAIVRWVSVEPMLGPVNLYAFDGYNALEGVGHNSRGVGGQSYPSVHGPHLDWVVIGCESGPGRRPMKIEWAEDLVDQCQEAGVAVFVKQLEVDGQVSHDPTEWPTSLRVREYPRKEGKNDA